MGVEDIITLLIANYSPSDLEDRLAVDLESFGAEALEAFVLENKDDIMEMFKEDGWVV